MGLRIHIVDDNPQFLHSLEAVLVRLPGVLVVARSGRCADVLAHARSSQAQLVLLDIGMPDGNGLDLIAPLRALCPPPHIMVLSLCESALMAQTDGLQVHPVPFIPKTDVMTRLVPLVEQMARDARYS